MKRFASACLLAGGLVSTPAPAGRPVPVRHEGSRLSMACVYSVVVYGPDAASLPRVVVAALDEVDRIDRLMSHYKPDSPLSRLNRAAAAGPVPVDPELFDFVAECLKYSRDSEGAFDITVGPLMKAWGFFRGEGRVPADADIASALTHVGSRHVVLDAARHTLAFDAAGVELDLGGIAKGYAVDRAVDVLRQGGVSAALVSAGGSTVYALGAPPGRQAWEVSLQDPIDARKVARKILLRDRALSVSGTATKAFEVGGVRYSHIMDPRTGRPVQGVLSVAVLAPSGTAGDALDDALFVLGVRKAREHLEGLPGVEAFFFLPEAPKKWRMVRLGS